MFGCSTFSFLNAWLDKMAFPIMPWNVLSNSYVRESSKPFDMIQQGNLMLHQNAFIMSIP